MLLRDQSTVQPVLARGIVDDERAVGAVLVESAYEVGDDGRLRRLGPVEREASDPPPPRRVPVWAGASVTASGVVRGGARPRADVVLRVGASTTRLAIWGERRWRRNIAGHAEPSAPGPIGDLAIGFEQAFGGAYRLPPGLLGDLPHPGFEVPYPTNPRGIGFYESEEMAIDRELPRIELEDQMIRRWDDRPEPGGLTPCPDLAGLRAPAEELMQSEPLVAMLRSHHHAPGRHIFARLTPGTEVSVEGLEHGTVTIRAPASPVVVTARRGRATFHVAFSIRSLHVDVPRRRLLTVHGHSFSYPRERPPSSIIVNNLEEAASCP